MSTYPPEKLLSLWATKQIDVDKGMGHSLQHIAKLYQSQTATNVELHQVTNEFLELKNRIFNLEHEAKSLRSVVERLAVLVEKPSSGKRKQGSHRRQVKDTS